MWQNGIVHWYDEKSGEGMIKVNNNLYYVHRSALNCDTLKAKQKVRVQIIEDTTFVQISKVEKGLI